MNSLEFGRTFVVMPKGTHTTTIVWLHGIGEKGSSWTQILESLPLPNIKWICPSAPTRHVTQLGGYPCTAWFNMARMSDDDNENLEGLDASATHVANLLSNEPDDVKLGVAGFSMGASVALYSATCRALGQYGNGNRYPINLSAAFGLSESITSTLGARTGDWTKRSTPRVTQVHHQFRGKPGNPPARRHDGEITGLKDRTQVSLGLLSLPTNASLCISYLLLSLRLWLPYPSIIYLSKQLFCRFLRNRIGASQEATRRAASLPVLLCHGRGILQAPITPYRSKVMPVLSGTH
ncbi:putative lysophospholipase [Helianthus annuus]|nr:putative lysophospholipase [Helianthus annuus]